MPKDYVCEDSLKKGRVPLLKKHLVDTNSHLIPASSATIWSPPSKVTFDKFLRLAIGPELAECLAELWVRILQRQRYR